jgi:hypothetical protein
MDPFAVPRAMFTLSVQLVQLPFEVGLRLLGGGDDDRAEATADRAVVGDERRSRSVKPRRQRAAKSGGQAASRRGRAGSRQRQATRGGQSQRGTATRKRGARGPTNVPGQSQTAAREVAEDVQERIEVARGQAAASQREASEQLATDATEPVEPDGRAGGVEDRIEHETASQREVPKREATQPAKPGETSVDDAAESVQERIEAAARRARVDHLDVEAKRREATTSAEDATDRQRAQADSARAAERPGATPSAEEAADRLRAQAEKARVAERPEETPSAEDAADRLRAQAENARAAERRGETPSAEEAADRLRAQAENARAAHRDW